MRGIKESVSHSAATPQETRYVFLPDHDRDYLLVKAAATHTLVERGPERAKEYVTPPYCLNGVLLNHRVALICLLKGPN